MPSDVRRPEIAATCTLAFIFIFIKLAINIPNIIPNVVINRIRGPCSKKRVDRYNNVNAAPVKYKIGRCSLFETSMSLKIFFLTPMSTNTIKINIKTNVYIVQLNAEAVSRVVL